MVALGQTIAVIDKSGKVVSTSKHLFGVFKEARTAYKERKAEIKAERRAQKYIRQAEETQRALAAYTIEDSRSVTSSRRHASRSKSVVRYGDHESHHPRRHRSHRHRSSEHDQDMQSMASSRYTSQRPHQELARRHTSNEVEQPQRMDLGTRSHSAPHIDMDLAYGDFNPSDLSTPEEEQEDLNGLVGKVRMVLDEAECAQHSAAAIIQHLQEKPDAMAAVALTLAEISSLVAKMAPTALSALKASAPAVFALLASPQFMIAAGVGIGVTIVMFGGYKIIKQITASNQTEAQPQPQAHAFPANQNYVPQDYFNQQPSVEEMYELNSRVSHIENWRRGVADWEAESNGTSVDGEFITRTAAAMSGIHLPLRVDEIRQEEGGSVRDGGSEYSRRSRSSRGSRSSRSSKTSRHSKGTSEASSRDKEKRRKHDKKDKERDKEKKDKEKKDKTKKPSPLRRLLELKH